MLWKIAAIGCNETIGFAASELGRCLRAMGCQVALLRLDAYDPARRDLLWVGQDAALPALLPSLPIHALDDAICVDVTGACGFVTGSNPRSVLIAAYRLLRELGCRWLRPGASAEILPSKLPETIEVSLCEAASSRHRGMCIEGAVSYDHVLDMIDWLPKIGMNSYFIQFWVPFTFFERWYAHQGNPTYAAEPLSLADVEDMTRTLVDEIKKRGLLYHATGHGWTCEPFGIEGSGWDRRAYNVPPEATQYFAEVNGERALFGGIPLNTQMCYSSAHVRDTITEAITQYCLQHPEVDYLHFWLADAGNNHCECAACADTLPSDYYVMMLNELDEKLTAADLQTKVVFLVYMDLLWAPQTQRIQNPERFTLMFAPITRSYTTTYANACAEAAPPEPPPYVRNKLSMPRDVAANVALLKQWQDCFDGDSFIFDYHYMWAHLRDPGYMDIAKVLFEDMINLPELGLNGMVSCQLQRAFFPTALGMYAMAAALWDRSLGFEAVADQYFTEAFGADGGLVRNYVTTLTKLFNPTNVRHERPAPDPAAAERFDMIPGVLAAFAPIVERNLLAGTAHPSAVRESWALLRFHAELCAILAKLFAYKARGDREMASAQWEDAVAWACQNEPALAAVFDVHGFFREGKNFAKGG